MIRVAIIPARMAASRFPGKPMAKIHGIPMIEHVYRRAAMCQSLHSVYVATCDREIYDHIRSIGGKAVMTKDTHQRCTDRTCEAMFKIEEEIGRKIDIAVMIQGDEPMVTPGMVELSLKPFERPSASRPVRVVNLMADIESIEEFEDPNEVKVVVDQAGRALYFSREPIPSRRKGATQVPMRKQVCVIPFTREYLIRFGELPETPLERIESVDMMRVLEHGEDVHMIHCEEETYSVDTPEDLEFVREAMKNDALFSQYAGDRG